MQNIINKCFKIKENNILVLCRTPFQALMIQHVVCFENISNYDLLYFTQNNSEEDKYYFNKLSVQATYSQYLYICRQSFDIINHFNNYKMIDNKIKKKAYKIIILSSFDNLSFRKIAVMQKNCYYISFDDGIGYISENSLNTEDNKKKIRRIIYEKLFFVPTKKYFLKKINRHYSVYRGYKNIISNNIIKYFDLFNFGHNNLLSQKKVKFFIGLPTDDDYNQAYISNIKKYIIGNQFDYYIRHPRESNLIVDSIPLLDKKGRIAEEAIFSVSIESRPLIVAGFSSVLFNISSDYADKIMLLDENDIQSQYYAELGKKAGCEIIYI